MQASVLGELRWRQKLFEDVAGFCRQGQFTLARFLALVPDRLDLSVGESLAKMQLPVSAPRAFQTACERMLVMREDVEPQAAKADPASLKQAIRLSQVSGDLDPLVVADWLNREGKTFVASVGGLYVKALRQAGGKQGGEETAYLVHLSLAEILGRKLADRSPTASASPGDCALVATLVQLALRAALGSKELSDEGLSARLGFQWAVTLSPLALGAAAENLLALPLNAYRTYPAAVALARERCPALLDVPDLSRLSEELARLILSNKDLRALTTRELILELLRDCLILALLVHPSALGPRGRLLRKLASSSRLLSQYIFDARRREELLPMLSLPSLPEPFPTLAKLLRMVERVQKGDNDALGAHGDVEGRARMVATGALLALLDQEATAHRAEVVARIRWIPEREGEAAYRDGRCYRLAFDNLPLFKKVAARQEAHLFVDMKDFTSRTAQIKERSMGDFLKRYFYEPIFSLAESVRGPSKDSLAVSNILGDAVAFRGDIGPMVALAAGIRTILDRAEQELAAALPDALGGGDSARAEIEEELSNAQAKLAELAGAATPADVAQRKRLQTQVALLEENAKQKTSRTLGLGMEAGVYIAFGAAAERVDLSHAVWGPWSVTIAERLNEAARGTARSGALKSERDRALGEARQARHSAQLTSPFQVRVGQRHQLELGRERAESLTAAIYRGDRAGLTASIKELAQWIHQQAGASLSGGGLPSCLSQSSEVFNAGCALSEAAMEAFERATRDTLLFERREVYTAQLPPTFHQTYLLEQDPERFVLVQERGTRAPRHLLRYAGKAQFKGFEKQGGADVWELLLVDSPFGRDFLREWTSGRLQ